MFVPKSNICKYYLQNISRTNILRSPNQVSLSVSPQTLVVDSRKVYPVNPVNLDGVEGNTMLIHLHEPGLLHKLHARYNVASWLLYSPREYICTPQGSTTQGSFPEMNQVRACENEACHLMAACNLWLARSNSAPIEHSELG